MVYTTYMSLYALEDTAVFVQEIDTESPRPYVLHIKDMAPEDKPREKLLKYGPTILSTSELLAIILSTGSKKEDVLAMASRILKEYGERTLASHTNPKQLARDLQVPQMKALQIVACAELGRRFFQKQGGGPAMIRSAQDVYDYLPDMRNLPKEHLRGIYLNAHYRIIHDEVISIGTIDTNLIHPREVFKPALEYGATAVILAHNHPSGITSASGADIEVTRQLVTAGKILGIHLLDHIVITKDTFASVDVEYTL